MVDRFIVLTIGRITPVDECADFHDVVVGLDAGERGGSRSSRATASLASDIGNRTQLPCMHRSAGANPPLSSPLSDGSSEADQSVVRFPVQVIHGKGLSG